MAQRLSDTGRAPVNDSVCVTFDTDTNRAVATMAAGGNLEHSFCDLAVGLGDVANAVTLLFARMTRTGVLSLSQMTQTVPPRHENGWACRR